MSFFDKMIEVAKSMGVKDFSYYKKWALDHLKKQLKEEDTVTKALEYCEEYMEKAYGVGTIRTWKGKKYIKGPDKKWRRFFDKHDRGANQAIKNIMREINSLENGDVEGLYAIIQKNAGRFRDENGNVLPEVQQIHDLVDKKQSGSEKKEKGNSLSKTDFNKLVDKYLISEKDLVNNPRMNIYYDDFSGKTREQLVDDNLNFLNSHSKGNPETQAKGVARELLMAERYKREHKEEKKDPTKEITEGSVVRFKENLEPGDENWIGVVLEDRGDTVVVQDVQSKMTIKPQHDYSKKDLVISKDAYKEREEDTHYWIQDSKGNRLTNIEAKKRIKGNLSQINSFNELIEERPKSDNTRMEIAKRSLENDNEQLLDRLNSEDRKEMKAEFKKYKKQSQKVSTVSPEEEKENKTINRNDVVILKLARAGFSRSEDDSDLDKNQNLREYVKNSYPVVFDDYGNGVSKIWIAVTKDKLDKVKKDLSNKKFSVSEETKESFEDEYFDVADFNDFIDEGFSKIKKDIEKNSVKKSFLEQIQEIMQKAGPEQKHDLEYYKKWAMSILDKQKEEPEEDGPNEDTVVKALAYTEMIAKAGYPVGTIREWKGQKYIKIAPNKWKPKYDNMGSRGAKMSLTNLKKAVAKCNSEEDLFNLINSNASRFRDENGNPFPEVQELHDMISKRQNEMNSSQPSNELENTSDGKSDGGKENGGKEEKKGDKKMKYSDKIAAIQNAGNKVVSETNKLAAGRPEDVATDAGDSAVNSVKTAAKDQEKKPVAAQNVLTPSDSEKEIEGAVTDSQTTEKVLSKYMGDNNPGETRKREGNKETVWGNDYTKKHKLEFKQNMAGVVLGKPQMDQELFEELSKYDVNSDSHLLAPKYGLEGAEFLNLVSKVREDRVNIVDSGSKKETFESLTEKYNATKDPDERESILNKIMSLEKEKNDTINDMKEETYEDMGYSEKTKEEIDNMDRAEFSEYMRREQKSIPMDKIGRGGGRITNFDNAYNVCKKIAETYGVSDEGVKKLQDFMTYNTDTASRLHDELNEKMGMSYELLDADYDMAYKNALKQLLGKKTNGDSDKEKAAVDKYHNNLGAAAKKYL